MYKWANIRQLKQPVKRLFTQLQDHCDANLVMNYQDHYGAQLASLVVYNLVMNYQGLFVAVTPLIRSPFHQ